MKKNLKKLLAAILAVMMLTAAVAALAEDGSSEPAPAAVQEAPKAEAPKAEAPKAEAPKAEAPKAEAPKAEEPKAEAPKAEAPKAEEPKAEAPKAEPAKEEAPKAEEETKPAEASKAEEPKAEEPKPEAPKAEEPKADEPEPEKPAAEASEPEKTEVANEAEEETEVGGNEAEAEPEVVLQKFKGDVKVEREGSGEIHYGEKVVLKAKVTGANVKYELRWEAKVNGNWKKVDDGDSAKDAYKFEVNEDTADLEYRVVVIGDEKKDETASKPYELKNVVKPVVEEVAPAEDAADVQGEEESPAEEPAEEKPAEEEPAEEPSYNEEEPAEEEPADEELIEIPDPTEVPLGLDEEAPVDEEAAEEEPVDVELAEEPVEEEAEEELPEEEIAPEEVIDKVENVQPAEAEMPKAIDTPIEAKPVVALANADVRVAADGLSPIIETLAEGAELKVLGIEGDWIMVDINGEIGYIYKDDVDGIDFEALEPEAAEEAAEAVDPTANMKVTIFSSRRTVMQAGETVALTSKLEGFEGFEVGYQWECDKGAGFEAVPGANGDTYTFEASKTTLSWGWRLTVSFR